MTTLLILLAVAVAAEWQTWLCVYAMLIALVDAGLVSAVGVAVWVRLGFGD